MDKYKTTNYDAVSVRVEKKINSRFLKPTINSEARMCDGVVNEDKEGACVDGRDIEGSKSTIVKLREKEEWMIESKLLGEADADCAMPRRTRYEAASRMVQMIDSEGSKDLLLRLDRADKLQRDRDLKHIQSESIYDPESGKLITKRSKTLKEVGKKNATLNISRKVFDGGRRRSALDLDQEKKKNEMIERITKAQEDDAGEQRGKNLLRSITKTYSSPTKAELLLMSGAADLRERSLLLSRNKEKVTDDINGGESGAETKLASSKGENTHTILSPTTTKIRSETSLMMRDMERFMKGETVDEMTRREKEDSRVRSKREKSSEDPILKLVRAKLRSAAYGSGFGVDWIDSKFLLFDELHTCDAVAEWRLL